MYIRTYCLPSRTQATFEIIKRIIRKGCTPVLAYTERYNYLQRNWLLVHQLYETGLLFQVNINSFSGYCGNTSLVLSGLIFGASDQAFLSK
jgi:tyrosine-protein phosphatase YwqE